MNIWPQFHWGPPERLSDMGSKSFLLKGKELPLSLDENCPGNQNHNEVPLHTSQNVCNPKICKQKKKKNLQAINAGEGVEKREPSYTVGGNVN